MRRFVARMIVFLSVQALLFCAVWRHALRGERNYLAAVIDKEERLRTTPSPKIVLVGGSNVAFGLRCDQIERELRRPVVNMGLVAGVGIPFLLDQVRDRVGPGDIVVLSFEYDIFSGLSDRLVVRQLLELRPSDIEYVQPERWKRLITDYGFSILGGAIRRAFLLDFGEETPPVNHFSYDRWLFDHCGSYIGHRHSARTLESEPADSPLRAKIRILPMPAKTERAVRAFVSHCAARGARCFFNCPPHPRELLEASSAQIHRNLDLLARIPGLVLLDQPEDQTYPLSDFYDTGYHLTWAAGTRRTQKLIGALRARCPGL